MASKLSKALASNGENPFFDIAKQVEEEKQSNVSVSEQKKSTPTKAPKVKTLEAEATKKMGRPKKDKTVKDTAHRIAINVNNDLFDYWKEEAEADRTTMAAIINQLLKAEKERRESGRE